MKGKLSQERDLVATNTITLEKLLFAFVSTLGFFRVFRKSEAKKNQERWN